MSYFVDIAPDARPWWWLSRRKRPTLAILTTFAQMVHPVGQAFSMAYVAPYQSIRRAPSSVVEPEHCGRDPSW